MNALARDVFDTSNTITPSAKSISAEEIFRERCEARAILYEAAELEGANIWQRIRHVTIPQTKLILLMLGMLQVVATMQMFIESFVLTNGGGGVGDNTQSVVMLIYQYAFAMSGASNYNSASALGVVLMLVLAVFSGGFLWATRERG